MESELVAERLTLILFLIFSEEDVQSYTEKICPNGGGAQNGNYRYSGTPRYGQIEGYGYSTDKCVCYTDGTGCNCDSQNEGLAVRNVATYGPAVVCVDASTWQDYTGGIMTSASGCSQKFMDVNHCVQVVGYAFSTGNNNDVDQGDGGHSRDDNHGGSKDGNKDGTKRTGYWIVRNQWSSYWGMSGYAYVAMGENTCGILNDMVHAYA